MTRHRTRIALAAVAAGATCAATAVTGIGPAAADPVSLILRYRCVYPLIGPQPLTVTIRADVPSRVAVGEEIEPFAVDTTSVVNAEAVRGLRAVHARTIEGSALASASLVSPDYPDGFPVGMDAKLERTALPESGELQVPARGTSPAGFGFTMPGRGRIEVGDLVLTLTPRLADGLESGLGTFESECTREPGQDNVLAEFDIVDEGGPTTPPPAPTEYVLQGSSQVRTPGTTMTLTGGLTTPFDGSGAFTGDLALDDTTASFRVLGFLPATAAVSFTPDGRTTGTLSGSTLTTTSKTVVGLPAVRVFGLQVGGGAQCRTSTPAELALSSANFARATGGTLTGTYTLPPVQGCGTLTRSISAGLTGPGNTAEVTLTPAGR